MSFDFAAHAPMPGEPGEGKAKPSASTVLVQLARDRYEFHVTDSGEAFGVPKSGPKVTHLIRGGKTSLRKMLAKAYFDKIGKAAPQQALADALLAIEGFAQDTAATELALRVARTGETVWLDLGDLTGRAIRITSEGWSIEQQAPMHFRRSELTGALPEPSPGGVIEELWEWINVAPEDRPLVLAYLVSIVFPAIPHPVLGVFGEQGTGKTSAQKVLVSLLDPSPVTVRKPPRDGESWITAAAGSWVVGIDNISEIQPWLSDSICRAVTGEGDVRRRLYTDGELAVFAYQRVITLNGIDLGAVRGDLADRMLPIHLQPIPEQERLEEDQLWPAWSKAHPRLLGAVLDLAARLIALLPSVRLETKPRMADFGRILAGIDQLLGTNGLGRYQEKQTTMASESLTDDTFVAAVNAAVTSFEGTSAELLARVTPNDDGWRRPKGWPASARQVTQRLKRQAPVMRKAGWTVDELPPHEGNILRWAIENPKTQERGRDQASAVSVVSVSTETTERPRHDPGLPLESLGPDDAVTNADSHESRAVPNDAGTAAPDNPTRSTGSLRCSRCNHLGGIVDGQVCAACRRTTAVDSRERR